LQALQAWLAHTDIGDDVPASLFQMPVPALFLRFGPEMAKVVDPVLWDTGRTSCTTQGVYIFETRTSLGRDITFVAIGRRPAEHFDLMRMMQLNFRDESESMVRHALRAPSVRITESGSMPEPEGASDMSVLVQMCIKVLLYMQTQGAVRTDEFYAEGDAVQQLARVGRKKVSKLERRLARRYNRIIVGPTQGIQYEHGEKMPHWRRGHIRMQPHGPQSSLRKPVFIAPVLIRADRLTEPQR